MSNRDKPFKLEIDQVLEKWTIVKKLGEGGFGAVYKVSDGTNCCAMKIETISDNNQVLKMEVYVLMAIKDENVNDYHFCTLYDKGRYSRFNYIVVTLVGESLQDLRKAQPQQHFSLGCAISIGIQTLEAIETLHSIGYLHRDIKPANFTVGRREVNELRRVYMLDFGMCRKFVLSNNENMHRKPRAYAGFRGTVRYAPLNCHISRDLGRKDDIETWMYMTIELTTGCLPWKGMDSMKEVGEYKRICRYIPFINELFGGCPRQYLTIFKHLQTLGFYDSPDYSKIFDLMKDSLDTCCVNEYPYDWETNIKKN
uniref:non-specific serine/threonine protein kinase n=1 Tax=Strongyloides venezuelensis TaxID=75913 RepID=A0A0K0G444_STRVS